MARRRHSLEPLTFTESPVPGVPVEFIRYVLTLPDETRQWLGNFLLDSLEEGFDGTPETARRLWKEELERRVREADEHPEKLLTSAQVFEDLKNRMEQMRRTPRPANLHGYHCTDYFAEGWAEKGFYCEKSLTQVIEPLNTLEPEQRLGFFAVGRPGVDGIRFGYRYGHHGLWVYYPIESEFKYLAPTLADLIEAWNDGKITL